MAASAAGSWKAKCAGVDRLLFPELVHSPVVVTNSRGVFDQPIAEYVLGLILAFAKDLPATLDLQRDRSWQHRETERIDGQRVLVLGAGPIGRAIGRLLSAAGMTVTGMDAPHGRSTPTSDRSTPHESLRRCSRRPTTWWSQPR